MNDGIARLLSVASDSLSVGIAKHESSHAPGLPEKIGQKLSELLAHRNGFYAFESALLFRPFDSEIPPFGVLQWNNPLLWKCEFKVNLNDIFFFAEDIFGIQFCIKDELIYSFDPETSELKLVAATLEEWCRWILEDSKTRTGWPIAHCWQLKQGSLRPGMRLLPKVPFVLGGSFEIENLYEVGDVEGMRFRADIANQIHSCPDGSKVVLSIKRRK